MGLPRQLPGRRDLPSNGERDKKCRKCGRRFSEYKIKKQRGNLIKVCPYCGCLK